MSSGTPWSSPSECWKRQHARNLNWKRFDHRPSFPPNTFPSLSSTTISRTFTLALKHQGANISCSAQSSCFFSGGNGYVLGQFAISSDSARDVARALARGSASLSMVRRLFEVIPDGVGGLCVGRDRVALDVSHVARFDYTIHTVHC